MKKKTTRRQPRRPTGAELGRELSDAVVMFHEAIAQRLNLAAADHKALGIIAREGPMTAGALARRTGLTPGAVTGLVDRLERGGHVQRLPDAADRRRIQIVAVPHQSGRHAAAFAALSDAMGAFMRRYTAEQLATIEDFCQQTIRVMREQTQRLSDEQSRSGANKP